jgi:hypothetical protein
MSVQYIFSIAAVFAVAHIYIYILYHKCLTPSLMFLVGPRKSETDAAEHVISLLCISSQDRKSTMIFAKNYQQIWV